MLIKRKMAVVEGYTYPKFRSAVIRYAYYEFRKLFRTTLPAVVKCCQLVFIFLAVHSQLDTRTANILQKFIASENRLYYLFALTASRELNELFVQFDNVATACQFHNAILNSLTCLNNASVNTIHN